jgi:hypothetical protein
VNRHDYQKKVFEAFAKAASIDLEMSNVEHCGEPDVRCRTAARGRHGYELTAATDGDFEQVARSGVGDAIWFATCVPCAAFHKLSRRYRYDIPVDLIVHESATPLPPSSVWQEDLAAMLEIHFDGSGFERIWVLDWKPSIVFRWPE